MTKAYLALVFTACIAFFIVVSFAFQAFHMWKTKNYSFLHKDLFILFLLTAIFFGTAFVSDKGLIENGGSQPWINNPIKYTWVGFNVFMGIACLGLLSFSMMGNGNNNEDLDEEIADSVSDLHNYEAIGDETTFVNEEVNPVAREENVEPASEEEAVVPNLGGNI